MDFDVVIVGAGPFGLSGAAYLRDKGLGVGVFGDPMSFWQNHMPAGMYLRSNWAASHISHPQARFTLDHFRAESGLAFAYPIPLERFIEYGKWYQQNAVPDLVRRQVSGIERNGGGFTATLDDGQSVKTKRVIIATGIAHFPWMPKELEGMPPSHVSHTSDHPDLSCFRGKEMLVVGGGQSALDAARLLSSFEARVELVAKQKQIRWVGGHGWLHHLSFLSWCLYSNYDVGPAGLSRLVGFPNFFRRLPRPVQDKLSYRAIRPAGTNWQRPYLAKTTMTVDCQVTSASTCGDRVSVKLTDGTTREVDHVIVGTGYKVDIGRYSFMSPQIRKSLKTASGSPVLGRGFESSVSGLHFVGKPAAWSFGPLLNFISGSHFAGAELVCALT